MSTQRSRRCMCRSACPIRAIRRLSEPSAYQMLRLDLDVWQSQHKAVSATSVVETTLKVVVQRMIWNRGAELSDVSEKLPEESVSLVSSGVWVVVLDDC